MIWKLLFQSLAPPLCHPGGLSKLIFYINVASAHQLTTSEKYPPQRLMGWKFLRENWGNVAWLVGSCGDSAREKRIRRSCWETAQARIKGKKKKLFFNLLMTRFQGYPWKFGSMTVQASYVRGRWHRIWAHKSPQHFFRLGLGNWRKSEFSGKTLRTWKFSKGNFFRAGTHRILTHSGFRIYSRFGWPTLCVRRYSGSKQGGIKCANWRTRFIDSEDPKHTMFCRETAFVAIYAFFRGNISILR